MAETMLERAARAVAVQWYCEAGAKAAAETQWKSFESLARAALEAIREPDAAMIRAAAESDADDGEGGTFGPVCDLLGFSGENKTRLVVAEALRASVDAILSQPQEGEDL